MVQRECSSEVETGVGGDAGNHRARLLIESGRRRQQPTAPSAAPFLLSEKQGAELGGISVRKFHELRIAGLIPEARVLGPRLLKWPRAELEQAYLDMPRQRLAGAEPLQLAKARAARAGTTEVQS